MERVKDLQHFFNNITNQSGLYPVWKLRLKEGSREGYCWKRQRIIDLGLENKHTKELILHELAHTHTCRFCNNKHTKDFWNLFRDYMRRFQPGIKVSESMRSHMSFEQEGPFYSIKYDDNA